MIKQEPKATRIWVRKPAGRPCFSRSKPIIAPRKVATAKRTKIAIVIVIPPLHCWLFKAHHSLHFTRCASPVARRASPVRINLVSAEWGSLYLTQQRNINILSDKISSYLPSWGRIGSSTLAHAFPFLLGRFGLRKGKVFFAKRKIPSYTPTVARGGDCWHRQIKI